MKTKRSKVNATNSAEEAMARSLDSLAAYDAYATEVAPILQKAVAERWSPERIYKEFGAYVAARSVTLALKEGDPGKALAAIQEVLNRGYGKATEKVETTHRYEKLADQELDQLLAAMGEAEPADPASDKH